MSFESVHALPTGTRLNGNVYEILRVLGHGGFGITYMALHKNLHAPVAIKEYLPEQLAIRQEDSKVSARSDDSSGDFEWGLSRFLEEGRVLARFNHHNIVRVSDVFEENNTAYLVMNYEKGRSLAELLDSSPSFSEEATKNILFPILDGLKRIHAQGYLHRDIKPANIIVRDDGTPILIDFGAARNLAQNKKGMTRIFTEYYAPLEQCSAGEQGPWTDLYALGAVAYKCLTGELPPEALQRVRRDPLVPVSVAAKVPVSREFAAAVEWALRVYERDRPQSAEEFAAAITGKTPVPNIAAAAVQGSSRNEENATKAPPVHPKLGSGDPTVMGGEGFGPRVSHPDPATHLDGAVDQIPPADENDFDEPVFQTSAVSNENFLSREDEVALPSDAGKSVSISNVGDAAGISQAPPETSESSDVPRTGRKTGPSKRKREEAARPEPPAYAEEAIVPDLVEDSVADPSANPADAEAPSSPRKPSRHWYVSAAALSILILAGALLWPRGDNDTPPQPDQIAWDAAVQADTIPAFEVYLKELPDGSRANDARARIQTIQSEVEAAWREAQTRDTAGGYRTFLTTYTKQGIHVTEAQDALRRIEPEEAEWQQVTSSDPQTIEAYQRFLELYPESRYRADAEMQIAVLQASKADADKKEDDSGRAAIAADAIAPCQTYVRLYPNGRLAAGCRTHMDEIRQRDTQYLSKLVSIGEYNGPVVNPLTPEAVAAIQAFQGRNSLEQTRLFDRPTMEAIDRAVSVDQAARVAYENAKQKRSRADYEEFLKPHSKSRYAADVASRIAQCRTETRSISTKELTSIQKVGKASPDAVQENACLQARSDAGNQAAAACIASNGLALAPKEIIAGAPTPRGTTGFLGLRTQRFDCTATVEVQCEITTTVNQSAEVCP